jgi:HK97 family phage prohead protease
MSNAIVADVISRGIIEQVDVRGINEEKRTASFVAATENGVMTWGGKEYLRMKGANLKRFRSNPVVLDTHNRMELSAVIGRADVKVEDRALTCDITFAKTPRGEEAWQLVKDKMVRALSVGFIPDPKRTLVLNDGETDGEGDSQITGPGRVIRSWELYEISVVPVPADPDTLRRSLLSPMSPLSPIEPGPTVSPVTGNGAGQNQEARTMATQNPGQPPEPAPKAMPQAPAVVVPPQETAEETRVRGIRALSFPGLEPMVQRCVLEGSSIEDARKRLLEESAKTLAPVGTPEAPAPAPKAEGQPQVRQLKDVPDDEFVRSICAPSA